MCIQRRGGSASSQRIESNGHLTGSDDDRNGRLSIPFIARQARGNAIYPNDCSDREAHVDRRSLSTRWISYHGVAKTSDYLRRVVHRSANMKRSLPKSQPVRTK